MLEIQLASILKKMGTSTSGTSCILHNSKELATTALYLSIIFNKML
jgi:hypothetical protein